jgi:hypothetical protein
MYELMATKREEFLRSLRGQAKVVVDLKPPPVQRIEVSIQGAPFEGGDKAPVTNRRVLGFSLSLLQASPSNPDSGAGKIS